jgi:hypothetical protein
MVLPGTPQSETGCDDAQPPASERNEGEFNETDKKR